MRSLGFQHLIERTFKSEGIPLPPSIRNINLYLELGRLVWGGRLQAVGKGKEELHLPVSMA
jgi:hypothetical protein